MRIDVHAHHWTGDYLDLLAQQLGKTDTGTQRGLGAGGGTDLDPRLRLMNRAGVEMQVLSASPQLPYAEDREKAPRRPSSSTISTPSSSRVTPTAFARSRRYRCRTSRSRSPRWTAR
jgi:hypothetical protein